MCNLIFTYVFPKRIINIDLHHSTQGLYDRMYMKLSQMKSIVQIEPTSMNFYVHTV